jgi:uncharacterized surface protein with fasciclin (FAS1) repeats
LSHVTVEQINQLASKILGCDFAWRIVASVICADSLCNERFTTDVSSSQFIYRSSAGCGKKTAPVMAGAGDTMKAKLDIVDTAVAAGSFNTLVAAVKAADLVDTLKGAGPFTVFAPTDEAFAKLPPGTVDALLKDKAKLTAILTYHVVAGKVLAKDVAGMKTAKTVNGADVAIDATSGVKVGGATVTKADIETSNGVIHVIDTVLMPPM